MTTSTRTRNWGGFVCLPENELALSACRWLAKWIRENVRPPFAVLYLHGEVGTGKTQLVTALANHVPGAVVVSAWEFAKAEYDRDLVTPPLLIVEGVHQLPKEAAERFVTLLDDRARRRRATAVTAADSPLDLTLPRRLTTRLAGGLTVALDPPGAESRATLAQFFSSTATNRLSRANAEDLAAVTPGGLRELRAAAHESSRKPKYRYDSTTRNNVRAHRPGNLPTDESHPLHAVTVAVAKAFKVSVADIRGESQVASVTLARQVVAYLGSVAVDLPHREITNFLNRSKSSFASVHLAMRWKMLRDPALNAIVSKLETDWRAKSQKLVARTSVAKGATARDANEERVG